MSDPPPAPAPSSPFSCAAASRTFVQTEPAPFWNTRPILRGHSDALRFGRPNNITLAIVGTPQERRSYAVGLLASAVLVLAFFGAWLVVLAALKCALRRPRRPSPAWSFLAGRPVEVPPRPAVQVRKTDQEEEEEAPKGTAPAPADEEEGRRPGRDGDGGGGRGRGTRDAATLPSLFPPLAQDADEDDEDGQGNGQGNGQGQGQGQTPLRHGASDGDRPADRDEGPAHAAVATDGDGGTGDGNGIGNGDGALPAGAGSVGARHGRSGSHPHSQDQDEQRRRLEQWSKTVRARHLRAARMRVAVLVSGLVIVAMAVLLIVYGIQRLSNSVSDSVNGIDQALALCDSAVSILDSYLRVRNDTVAVASAASIETNFTVCPAVEETLCGGQPCANVLQQVVDYFARNHVVYDSLASVQHDVLEIKSLLTSVDQTITSFDYAFWVAAAAVCLLAVCTLILMNGVVLAWRHKLRGTCWHRTTARFRGYFVVPIFVVLLVVGWIASMVFVIGLTATADFCFDSPDQNVLAVLDQLKDNFSSFLYPMLVYYISGCPDLSVVQSTGLQDVQLVLNLLGQSEAFLGRLESQSQSHRISQVCGTDPTTVTILLSQLDALLCYASNTVFDTVDFFTCANWNGLYASVMYSAVCYNGNTGFAWIAVAQFVIVLCSMIMLTLRSAFYELVDQEEEEDSAEASKPAIAPASRRRCREVWRRCARRRQSDPESAPAWKRDAESTSTEPRTPDDEAASPAEQGGGPPAADGDDGIGTSPDPVGSNDSNGRDSSSANSNGGATTVRVCSLYTGSLPSARENL